MYQDNFLSISKLMFCYFNVSIFIIIIIILIVCWFCRWNTFQFLLHRFGNTVLKVKMIPDEVFEWSI